MKKWAGFYSAIAASSWTLLLGVSHIRKQLGYFMWQTRQLMNVCHTKVGVYRL